MTDARARVPGPRRFRLIFLAPILAFIALSAWAFASPIGAGPDDDYHLVSVWCADGGNSECTAATNSTERTVAKGFTEITCFAQVATRSAACQKATWAHFDDSTATTKRGNFVGEYPPLYYATMHAFASVDIQTSALVMRLINAALFVALATALAALLSPMRRRSLLWGWLVALVPLGMFLIPSNNPSGWAITGVGTAFLALLGWFESSGRRHWALGALYVVGMVMAAGARGDAAVYAIGATVTVSILTVVRNRGWLISAILPVAGLIIAVAFLLTASQAGDAATGFSNGGPSAVALPGASTSGALGGPALAAYNLLMLPFLWTGVWGSWGLGWLDTSLPALVSWSATAAFIVVAFAGLGRMNWRKAIASTGVLIVLVVLPVYVLTAGGDQVGTSLQPRYLLPLIVLFAFLLITDPVDPLNPNALSGEPTRRTLGFTRIQTVAIFGALALANLVSLQVNIRRYVTGVNHQGVNLDAGAQWWWTGFPVGPTAVWLIGSLAYIGLLVVLWPMLRRTRVEAGQSTVLASVGSDAVL